MSELSDEYTCCVNLDEDWWIKIINNYGITDFINIKNNLRNISEIEHVEDIFTHIILPPTTEDQFGNIISWRILDYENLYTLNELPQQYNILDHNPDCCFDPESENLINVNEDKIKTYFDNTIFDF